MQSYIFTNIYFLAVFCKLCRWILFCEYNQFKWNCDISYGNLNVQKRRLNREVECTKTPQHDRIIFCGSVKVQWSSGQVTGLTFDKAFVIHLYMYMFVWEQVIMEPLLLFAVVYVMQGNTFSAWCTVARSTDYNIILILKCLCM